MEDVDALDEWRDLVVSPKCLYSGIKPDGNKSIFEAFNPGYDDFGTSHGIEVAISVFDTEMKLGDVENGSVSVVDMKNSVGSIAERRAAKLGFDAAKIKSPRFRCSGTLSSPIARSSCIFTIPPGISPTVLLESPIMLPNSQLSPTTGTFALPPLAGDSETMNSTSPGLEEDKVGDGGFSSELEPYASCIALPCLPALDNQSLRADDCQSLSSMQPPGDFHFPVQFPREAVIKNCDTGSLPETKISDDLAMNSDAISLQPSNFDVASGEMQNTNGNTWGEDSVMAHTVETDPKGIYPPVEKLRTAEDGYNWRKYGQKQVKGSEYPRSYYKCTHPSCQVKKKVERSHDGQITEIIYKGAHNHPKPQPCRKSAFGSGLLLGETSETGEGNGSYGKGENGPVWRNVQHGCNNVKTGSEWRADGLERTPSASVVTEASDPLSTTEGKSMGFLESVETPELSSTFASYEDDEDVDATQGSFAAGDEDENESDLKRRKKDGCFVETSLALRAVREPRVVVQIESEVDILDDGYRWRKYGQKVVKGNPNPRSYYKCTSAGCTVRKHVERASHDLKSVITTYEGKHNHEVPAARNSSQLNSGNGNLPSAPPLTQSSLSIPRNPHLPKPEPHLQDLDLKIESNEFSTTSYLKNLGNAPLYYQMKFPALPNAMTYGSLGLHNHHQLFSSSMAPGIPDLSSIPLPLRFSHPSDLPIGGYCNPERPLAPVQAYFSGQSLKGNNDVKLMTPKPEQREDAFFDTGTSSIKHMA